MTEELGRLARVVWEYLELAPILQTIVETWDWGLGTGDWGLGGGLINWRWTTPRQRREQNNRGERQKYELLLIGK